MPTIQIPSSLRAHTAGQARLTVPGKTVSEVLGGLCALHPGLATMLYTPRGQLRPHVTLFVGEDDHRCSGASLAEDAELVLVTAIAGG